MNFFLGLINSVLLSDGSLMVNLSLLAILLVCALFSSLGFQREYQAFVFIG
jgi:hypothetical protein